MYSRNFLLCIRQALSHRPTAVNTRRLENRRKRGNINDTAKRVSAVEQPRARCLYSVFTRSRVVLLLSVFVSSAARPVVGNNNNKNTKPKKVPYQGRAKNNRPGSERCTISEKAPCPKLAPREEKPLANFRNSIS